MDARGLPGAYIIDSGVLLAFAADPRGVRALVDFYGPRLLIPDEVLLEIRRIAGDRDAGRSHQVAKDLMASGDGWCVLRNRKYTLSEKEARHTDDIHRAYTGRRTDPAAGNRARRGDRLMRHRGECACVVVALTRENPRYAMVLTNDGDAQRLVRGYGIAAEPCFQALREMIHARFKLGEQIMDPDLAWEMTTAMCQVSNVPDIVKPYGREYFVAAGPDLTGPA